MPPSLTWEQIEDLYDAGCSLRECERISGVNRSTIYSHFRRAGKKMRPAGPAPGSQRLSNRVLNATRKLYESGYSSSEISRLIGISDTTVLYRIRKAGGQIRTSQEGVQLAYDRGYQFGGRLQKQGWSNNGRGSKQEEQK